MIKVVELCYVHFPADTTYSGAIIPARTELRVVTWQPRVDSQELVPYGYAISVDVESNIKTLLANARYTECNSKRAKLALRNFTFESGIIVADLSPVEPIPEHSVSAHLLGNYLGQKVYALMAVNCSIHLKKAGYKKSVIYNEETVLESLARCADAQFFTEFLQEKLAAFAPKF